MDSATLAKRVFSYGTVTTVTVAAMFLFHVIAGRLLGVEDYGKLSFALTLALVLSPLLDPGIYYLSIREIARDNAAAQRLLAHGLTWRLVCGFGYLALVLLVASQIRDSVDTLTAVVLVAIGQIFLAAKDGIRAALLGLERFGSDAISLVIDRFGVLTVCGTVLAFGGGLEDVCWAYLIVRLADFLAAIALVAPRVSISLGRDFSFLVSMLRAAFPIGAFYITLNVYSYVDVIMLATMRGNQEVGWYSAAYRLYEGPVLVPTIVGTVFMPLLSRLWVENRQQFVVRLRHGILLVVAAAIAVSVVGIAVSQWVIVISFGTEFGESAIALRILLLGAVFVFTINFLQTALISIDRQKIVLIVAVTGLVANVLLNVFLIPAYGFLGASAATVAAEIIACGMLIVFVVKIVRSKGVLVASEVPADQ